MYEAPGGSAVECGGCLGKSAGAVTVRRGVHHRPHRLAEAAAVVGEGGRVWCAGVRDLHTQPPVVRLGGRPDV
ncbi:hypothetical protein GCM10027162_55180 [Streptomyces incanus]